MCWTKLTLVFVPVIAVSVEGCRLAGGEGPVPRPLATSRHLSQLGMAAMERQDWVEAERLLAQAVSICPEDLDARRHYAEVLWNRGLRDKAVVQLEEADRLGKEDPALHVLIARMRLAMGQPSMARARIDRAIDIQPHLAEAWKVRGAIAHQEGKLEQALADYHRALGLNPEDRDLKLAIADIYQRTDRPARALAILHSLAESYAPGEEPASLLVAEGSAYQALGRYEEAVESFTGAIHRGATSAENFYRLAEALRLAGRPSEAARAVQEALAIDPQHLPSRTLRNQLRLAEAPVVSDLPSSAQ